MTEFDINKIPSQKGRISIVTGANSGIGFETALALARKGMKVIMACRNQAKAEKAKKDILIKVPGADLEIMQIDLSTLSSVRDFAETFLTKYNQLDMLINNAGIMIPPYSKTEDGFESQMGANYFGHFLLTGLLLDIITKTPDSRIITVSSLAHKKGKINFEDLHWEKKYSAMGAYRQSKLACLMFSYELQRRLEKTGSNTLSLAAHPGLSITNLVMNIPKWVIYVFYPLTALFTHSPAKAALPSLMAALGRDVNGGEFFGPQGHSEMKGKPGKAESTSLSHNPEVSKQLWELSEKLTGIKYL
jgi:NAD(P)-dependent dehydrogenase (short-subunit alcohol dehydrogenase family)